MNLSENPSETVQNAGDILIIDDTPDNLRFLSDLLSRAGYNVRKVINGELGLEAAQLEPPELILLDIKMPGLNGYKVCDQLKTNACTSQIPVIFLSALSEELDKVMAFEAGGVDYITKPFQIVEVLARIENHLQVSRLRKALQQQNAQLQQEIEQRTSAESALASLNQGLEAEIQARIAPLQQQNQLLVAQLAELQQTLGKTQQGNLAYSQTLTHLAEQVQPHLSEIATGVKALQLAFQSERIQSNPVIVTALQQIIEQTQLIEQAIKDTANISEAIMQEFRQESAAAEVVLQPLNLTQFCQAFVEQWQQTSQRQVAFVRWGKSPGLVATAPDLLRQICQHLLNNAAAYSAPDSTILLQLTYESTQVILQVRDEGIGIPPAEIDRVFEPSYRASNVHPFSGTGLGLTVAQQLAIQLRGSLRLDSELGKGTIATLLLPLA